jgi:hypothetical protein
VDELRELYRKRRKLLFRSILTFFLSVTPFFYAGFWAAVHSDQTVPKEVLIVMIIGFILMVLGIIGFMTVQIRFSRCPKCEKYVRGLILVKKCPRCGLIFREVKKMK